MGPAAVSGRAPGLDGGGEAGALGQQAAEGGGLEAHGPAGRRGDHRGRPRTPPDMSGPFADHVAGPHVADIGGFVRPSPVRTTKRPDATT